MLRKADDVRLVQRGLYLVHDAKRRGPDLDDGEVQRDGHEGRFAAGEQRERRERLAGWLHLYIYIAGEHVLAGLERELRLAAAEELREGLAEALVYRGELAGEYSSHFPGYVGNYTQQLIFRLLHVVALGGQELVALADARVLVYGAEVRRAEGAHLLLELGYAAV